MPRSEIKLKDALKDVQAKLKELENAPPIEKPKEKTKTLYSPILKEWITIKG